MYNFVMDTPNHGQSPYITIAEYGITFPQETLKCLNYAQYVHVFFDDKNRVVAFQAAKKMSMLSVFMIQNTKSSVRWDKTRFRDHIARLMGISPSKHGMRIKGKMIDCMLIFNLKAKAKPCR